MSVEELAKQLRERHNQRYETWGSWEELSEEEREIFRTIARCAMELLGVKETE